MGYIGAGGGHGLLGDGSRYSGWQHQQSIRDTKEHRRALDEIYTDGRKQWKETGDK